MITFGQILMLVGCLLISGGFLLSYASLELTDIFVVIYVWCFLALSLKFHKGIFKKERILVTILPLFALSFLWLLLNINKFLLLWLGQVNTYAVLIGWGVFNTGLYYDTRKVLRISER
ncbi:MAG: hypothetical protein QXF56_04225 [Candidatus Micrarchaeia archaeon]